MLDDPTLLRRYATERTEAAFAELVRRHLPLVYSAAVRRLNGDTHRAEDIAQIVFCTVAREADRLAQHTVLTGWLYTATRNAVIDEIRSENRRRAREQEAQLMQATLSDLETPMDWGRLRPVIDSAMDELSADDREAVLLRFFQSRPFAEIGATLGLSEDAARKRVDRALDKLGGLLSRHKIVSTSAALAALLASETIAATPAGLAATVTAAAMVAGGAATAATAGATALLTVTKLQMGLAAAVIAGGAVGLITQQSTISTLHERTATTQRQLAKLEEETARLANANTAAATERAGLLAEVAALKSAATIAARNPAVTTAPASARSSFTPTVASSPAAANRAQSNPTRLAHYHQRFDPFIQQRGLTPDQADKLFEILGDWDDVSTDFQAAIRAQGLVWTPEAQKLRNDLQQKIENEPLRALLGVEGRRAYFEFEASSFYRALVEPFTQRLTRENLPLTEEQTTRLVELAKAHKRSIKPDPTSMGTLAVVDWDPVVASAAAFVSPAQLTAIQAEAARLQPAK